MSTEGSGFEAVLARRMARLAENVDRSDWADVVARAALAAGTGSKSRRRPRRRALYLAAAVAVVAAVVGPLQASGRFGELFAGEPAPAFVKDRFAEVDRGAPANLAPGVDPEGAVKLLSAETPSGSAILWVAPTKSGSWCMLVVVGARPVIGPGCNGPVGRDLPIAVEVAALAEGTWLVAGTVGTAVAAVSLHVPGQPPEGLALEKGFFLVSAKPVEGLELVAADGSGNVIARTPVQIPRGASPGQTDSRG